MNHRLPLLCVQRQNLQNGLVLGRARLCFLSPQPYSQRSIPDCLIVKLRQLAKFNLQAVSEWRARAGEQHSPVIDSGAQPGKRSAATAPATLRNFVDDLANVVPAVLTLAMMGIPLKNWEIYTEPVHAVVYTRPTSPEMAVP